MNNLNNIPGEVVKTSYLPDDVPTHLIGVIIGNSPKTVKYSIPSLASQITNLITDLVRTSVSYTDPSWITSLAWSKISGAPAFITGINSSNVTTALGYTPVPDTRTLTINGTAYDLTTNRNWTISSSQWVDTSGGIQYPDNVGIDVNLSRMTQMDLSNLYPNFTISNYDTLSNGAVIYRNLSGGANISPLVNGTTYYVKKITGIVNPVGNLYINNQIELYTNSNLTGVIYLTQNIVGNHYLEQSNRTLSNTIIANQNLQIDDGFLLINAKQYKTGDVNWISPKNNYVDTFLDDGETINELSTQSERATTLLVGPYTETSTNALVNSNGVIVLHSDLQRSFIGVTWNGKKYGITPVLPALTGGQPTASVGGYYSGMGIGGMDDSSSTEPMFGVLAGLQSGFGRSAINFTVFSNKRVHTFNNILDDGAGRVGINTAPSEFLHIGNTDTLTGTNVRIDNNSQSSTTVSSQINFYRTRSNSAIDGAMLLGKINVFGLGSAFTQSASIEFRSVSGVWTTSANRSAQMLFFTIHQNTFAERLRLTSEGNLLLNTTTNGTFKFDCNGTARIQNVLTLGNLATDPTGGNGMIYYNTTTNKFRGYENGAWVNLI